jgi:protein O-GlcNAc transferase
MSAKKLHVTRSRFPGPIDLDRAIFHYKEALRVHPRYVTALCNLGLAFYNKGKYEEAASSYTKVLEINPQKTDTRMDLANIFFLQAKHEKAISEFLQEKHRF